MLEIVKCVVAVHAGNKRDVVTKLVLDGLAQLDCLGIYLELRGLLVEQRELDDSCDFVTNGGPLLQGAGKIEHSLLGVVTFRHAVRKNLPEQALA